jgi:WD40 repeat protein/energy-coupling factor transporter ATP-binding protein EcfA2
VPRPERPLGSGDDPLTRFAADLRELRRKAGNPGYRELTRRAHYSATTLSDAAGGRKLPSLSVTVAYVRACDGSVEEWEKRWRDVAAWLDALEPKPESGFAAESAPYVGLATFQPQDADRFYGREELVDQLVRRVSRERVVMVVGASGSGKSSLLRAGLIARLDDSDSRHETVLFTPGRNPLDECSLAIAKFTGDSVMTLREALASDPHALSLIVRQEWDAREDSDGDLVLVIDQFEELFTLRDAEAEAEHFVTMLSDAVSDDSGRLRLVLGVRADFCGECAQLPGLSEHLRNGTLLVGPMSASELRQVITVPASHAGCTVEGTLLATLLGDMHGRPGALPLLSHALLETWRRRRGNALTLDGYQAAGGVAGALERTAESCYEGLSERQRELAKASFLRLVTPDATKRRLPHSEIDHDDPDLAAVVARFAEARLLVVSDTVIELAHESLISAWPQLRAWLDEDSEGHRIHRQLTEATSAWESTGRDTSALYRGAQLAIAQEWAGKRQEALATRERNFLTAGRRYQRREVRRWWVIAALLLVATLVSGVLTAVTIETNAEISRYLAAANARVLADQALEQAPLNADRANQLALAAFRTDPTNGHARTALARQYIAMHSVERSVHGIIDRPVEQFEGAHAPLISSTSSSNGDALLLPRAEGVTVVRGIVAGKTHSSVLRGAGRDALYFLTPDGKWVMAIDTRGGLHRWDLRTQKKTLLTESFDIPGSEFDGAFSADSRRFVRAVTQSGKLEVWSVESGRKLHSLDLPAPLNISQVALADHRDLVLVNEEVQAPNGTVLRIVARSLSTGKVAWWARGNFVIAEAGSSVLSCAGKRITVRNSDNGRQVRDLLLETGECPCPGLHITADGGHLVATADSIAKSPVLQHVEVIRLSDGESRRFRVPRPNEASRSERCSQAAGRRDGPEFTLGVEPRLGVATRDGSALLFVVNGRLLITLRPHRDMRGSRNGYPPQVLPGGKYMLESSESAIRTLDAHTGSTIAISHVGGDVGDRVKYTVIEPTGKRFAYVSFRTDGNVREELDVYTVPRLGKLEIGLPRGLHASVIEMGLAFVKERLVAVGSGQVVVWDASTGQMIGAPTQILGDGSDRSRELFGFGPWQVVPRPRHNDEVALLAPDGSIRLWNISRRAPVGTLRAGNASEASDGAPVFNSTGDIMALSSRDGSIELWDVDSRRVVHHLPAVGRAAQRIIGFNEAGELLTQNEQTVSVWGINGDPRGTIPLGDAEGLAMPEASRLSFRWEGGGVPLDVSTNPRAWFEHLCAIQNRPFDAGERTMLPPGVSTDPPCGRGG